MMNPMQQTAYGGGLIVSVGLESFLRATLGDEFDFSTYIDARIGPDDTTSVGVLYDYYKTNYQLFNKTKNAMA